MLNVHQLIAMSEPHINIVNAWAKAWDVLGRFSHPVCSISGGSDSDILLHFIHSLDEDRRASYIWFNTGLEFEATKRHLAFLEEKYNIAFIRLPPVKPVAVTVKMHGYPFLSKYVSARISQLQRHAFDFKGKHVYEEDLKRYPNCKNSLDWWHNKRSFKTWRIDRYPLLKEFLIAHPPHFSISDLCCEFSKKKVAHHFFLNNYCDLSIIGTRKLEGGIRQAHNSCFNPDTKGITTYRPLFWFSNHDKTAFEQIFSVTHSDCYSLYGLERTGCAGCPFNPHVFTEIEHVRPFEEGIIHAAEKIFRPSYEYTKLFREFRAFYHQLPIPFGGPS